MKENTLSLYYETLGGLLAAIEKNLEQNQVVLSPENPLNDPFQYGGIPYETTKEAHYKLDTIKGKNTRKYLHVSIYRMSSGRYELTNYLL